MVFITVYRSVAGY